LLVIWLLVEEKKREEKKEKRKEKKRKKKEKRKEKRRKETKKKEKKARKKIKLDTVVIFLGVNRSLAGNLDTETSSTFFLHFSRKF
jgi:outer membrane biosynthesis protein TonB